MILYIIIPHPMLPHHPLHICGEGWGEEIGEGNKNPLSAFVERVALQRRVRKYTG